MAKEVEAEKGTVEYTVKNMDVGNRDYPLLNGGTLYLPMKKKNANWPVIKETQISRALRRAEKEGHVQLIKKGEK